MRILLLLSIILISFTQGYSGTVELGDESFFSELDLLADTSITDSIDDYIENREVENDGTEPEDELTYDTEPFLVDEVCSTHKTCIVSLCVHSLYISNSLYILSAYSGFFIIHSPPPKVLS